MIYETKVYGLFTQDEDGKIKEIVLWVNDCYIGGQFSFYYKQIQIR